MDTIRLTYSPYGFGKVLRIITPSSDENNDGGELEKTVPTEELQYSDEQE